MSRKQFCQGVCAAATQLVFGEESSDGGRTLFKWKSTLLEGLDQELDFDMSAYTDAAYQGDVARLGLGNTWNRICKWLLARGETDFLKVGALGDLYEEGLAISDKANKKASGQYYTPEDVARIMSEWLTRLPGDAVCDVGCGVGNLILAYLSLIGTTKARRLLSSGNVYLYDLDETALQICLTSIAVRYGRRAALSTHAVLADFLDRDVSLPPNCKVISNPPYAAVKALPESWVKTDVVVHGKELYSAFMEKIMLQSKSSVVITPYSFIGADKYYPLRRVMNDRGGFVVSFDNVPGMIFIGRKHGIFNSNTGNSVRAAITVVDGSSRTNGFRMSPLIRFKNVERQRLLDCATLEGMLGSRLQRVSPTGRMFAKCDRRLEEIFGAWCAKSSSKVRSLTSQTGRFRLSMPNTCRYFTAATDEPLSRKGQITLKFADEDAYWYVFSMVNSSFAYWHWRLYDGGITYPRGLLLDMPSFFDLLDAADRKFCKEISREMIARREEFIIRKTNVGVQENVKYPREFRDRINRRFLRILGVEADATVFDVVHSNMALEVSLCETKFR